MGLLALPQPLSHHEASPSPNKALRVGREALTSEEEDPWTSTYESDASGYASIALEIAGFTLQSDSPRVAGHVVVAHDSSGALVACGLVVPTSGAFVELEAYPSYAGGHPARGTLLATRETDSSVAIEGTLVDLEASASGGLHIHSGFTCADADGVGGHFYDGLPADPWTTTYSSDAQGAASVHLSINRFTLNAWRSIEFRAVVAHESGGARSGCGVSSGVEALVVYNATCAASTIFQDDNESGSSSSKKSSGTHTTTLVVVIGGLIVGAALIVVGAVAFLASKKRGRIPEHRSTELPQSAGFC